MTLIRIFSKKTHQNIWKNIRYQKISIDLAIFTEVSRFFNPNELKIIRVLIPSFVYSHLHLPQFPDGHQIHNSTQE